MSENVAKNGYVREHETTCHDAHGHAVTVELTATFLSDETNQPLGMSVILRDVTERKRREEEIRRLNASLSDQVTERTRELAEKVDELARANAELREARSDALGICLAGVASDSRAADQPARRGRTHADRIAAR